MVVIIRVTLRWDYSVRHANSVLILFFFFLSLSNKRDKKRTLDFLLWCGLRVVEVLVLVQEEEEEEENVKLSTNTQKQAWYSTY